MLVTRVPVGDHDRARVKRLVLCHYAANFPPIDAATITGQVKDAAAKAGYGGEIVAATELEPIALSAS
jgi:hypothetical protein